MPELNFEDLSDSFDKTISSADLTEVKDLLQQLTAKEYRVNILEKTIADNKNRSQQCMPSILHYLIALFDYSVKKSFPEASAKHVLNILPCGPKNPGDYQCSSALQLAKILKDFGINLNPKEVAQVIMDNTIPNDIVEKMELSGPGFINVWTRKEFYSREILEICANGVKPPFIPYKQRIVVDMSSPNIAKEMHVGHLRSTIIGESISRLLAFIGHDVVKINHLGDWGTQFGMLIANLKDKFPNYLKVSPPIGDLQMFYKEAKKRFDEEEEFKKRAYREVVDLQSGKEDSKKAWELICDVSRKEFSQIYKRLDIENLKEVGESFYQSRMEEVVKDLKERDLLQFEEGRALIWPTEGEIPLTIVKSDGGFTYDTSDLAALRYRLMEQRADRVLYVVDSGQAIHLQGVFNVAKKIGYMTPGLQHAEHVGFGVVLGEDKKKFKTRSGETVRLVDLLNEGLERSLKRLEEKGRTAELPKEEIDEIKESVAYSCIKYADLSHNRTSDYVFSFDKMLEDKGNTAVYLLYSYTRICSIGRIAGLSPEDISAMAKNKEPLIIDHEKEIKLAKVICKLSEILLRIQSDLLMHTLCDYLYEISCTFTEFYDVCYCVEKDPKTGNVVKVNKSRMMLCNAAAKVMKQGFDILGIKPLKRM